MDSDPDDEEENDDDFDSDCSIISEEILDVDKFLEEIKENLGETINKEQDQILSALLDDLDKSKNSRELDLDKTLNSRDLLANQETHSELDDLISSMSELLRIKTQLLQEANLDEFKRSQSSFELNKTLADLELKISTLKIADKKGEDKKIGGSSAMCKIETKSQSCAYQKVQKVDERLQHQGEETGHDVQNLPTTMFDNLRNYKKGLEIQKMNLLEHKEENRYFASRCKKCTQAFLEGRFDEDKCKRKIEVDVFVELADVLIDSANAQSSGLKVGEFR